MNSVILMDDDNYKLWVLAFISIWFLLIIFVKRVNDNSSLKRLPPGPYPLPLLGNLVKVATTNPHKRLAELATLYGPIMTLKLGSLTTIIISCPSIAKEMVQKHGLSLSTRFVLDSVRAYQHDQHSIACLPALSTKWRTFRRIFKTCLFSKPRLEAMQGLRFQVVNKLMEFVENCANSGIAVDFGETMFQTSFDFMLSIIFSMDSSHSTSKEIMGLVCDMIKEAKVPNLADYYPIFKKVDPQGLRYRLSILCKKLFKVFDEILSTRLDARNKDNKSRADSCTNDLLDVILDIIEDENGGISKRDALHMILDLFVAGTDTTSLTLEWAMVELIRNPSTLRRAQKEMDMAIDKCKEIQDSDICRLPYLQAIVKETFRLHPAAPLLLPCRASQDLKVFGFTIPKDSQVIINAWALGRHPSAWPNPNSFVPERFLGSEIDVKGKDFGLIPFGAGRRICPGLPLANDTVHIVLASLIRSFNWELPGGIPNQSLDMDDIYGITLKKAKPLRAIPMHRI